MRATRWRASPRPMSPTRPSPSAMCARSRSRGNPCGRCASPMSASLAGNCYVPIAATGVVFDALMEAGRECAIRPVGYRALESLRLEKGYRAWGSDITPNDTPFRGGPRLGGEAAQEHAFHGAAGAGGARRQNRSTKRFAGFTLDDPDVVLVGPRDDPAQRRAGRLSHQRRLSATRLARASATAMSATRPASTTTTSPTRNTSLSSPTRSFPPRSALSRSSIPPVHA